MPVTNILSFFPQCFPKPPFPGSQKPRPFGWLVVLRFNTTLTAKVISWRSATHVFPGFLTAIPAQISFQSH